MTNTSNGLPSDSSVSSSVPYHPLCLIYRSDQVWWWQAPAKQARVKLSGVNRRTSNNERHQGTSEELLLSLSSSSRVTLGVFLRAGSCPQRMVSKEAEER